ncbi:hypothetical protein [Saccharopolyspora tripterygii]
MTFPNIWGKIGETVDRMADTVAYAASQNAGGAMTVDPDQVDEIAGFFREKAQILNDRAYDVQDMGTIEAAGGDPVSTGSANAYGQVVTSEGDGYFTSYRELATVLLDAAHALEQGARQWRVDDDNAATSFGGGKS